LCRFVPDNWLLKRGGILQAAKSGNGKLYALLYDTSTDQPKPAGTLIIRKDYAEALEMIAADPFNFYSGAIADDIIQTVQMCWNLLIM